jgi:hypothetical protein
VARALQEPGGEYVTVNNDFPEDMEFRVPVRDVPVASFLFSSDFK